MALGEERHELRLGRIRVLELVHEDVPEAPLQLEPGGRRLAQEAQGQADLVTEVDQAGLAQEGLVASVGPGELELAAAPRRRAAAAAGAAGSGPADCGRRGGQALGLADQPVGAGEVGRPG